MMAAQRSLCSSFIRRPQKQQAGLLVDISTLAGSFLFMRDNYVVANSPTTPADKFLIIPVGVQ
jgi:hypothetical protein